jgi:hypothetical protein
MKLDLLTNATVVDDAIRFVSDHSRNNNKLILPKKGEGNRQESNDPDYNEENSELEEKQEEQTREMATTTTTTNQVF